MAWTSLPPSNIGISTAGGAAAGGAATGGAEAVSVLGGSGVRAAFGTAATFGVSGFGSGGFCLGGSGGFSLGTSVAVSFWNFLPKMPSWAAKKTTATITSVWKTSEKIRLIFDEFRFLRA